MVEEITQSHNTAPFEVGKKPKNQDSGFSSFLKEAQSEFDNKEGKRATLKDPQDSKSASKKEEETNGVLAKGKESSDIKETKKSKNDLTNEEIKTQTKGSKGIHKGNTKDDANEESEDSLANHKLANAKNFAQSSVLSQVLNQQSLSTGNEQSNDKKTNTQKRVKDAKNTLPQDSNGLGTKPTLNKAQSPKTLEDIRHLAQANGLNPSKVEGLKDGIEASAHTKDGTQDNIPESAKHKVQYKIDDDGERVAIIHRGTRKPQNITSKISSIYETFKADTSASTIGSLLGLKDLP